MTDTNTAEREALMDLIDAYAEARHVGGCHTYNAKTAEARAKVIASLAASAGSSEGSELVTFELPPTPFEPFAQGVEIGYDLWGGADIRLGGEFVYVHINYDYRYTHNAARRSLAEQIAGIIAGTLFTHPSPPEGMAGWVRLPGQLPEPGTPVLLDIDKKFPIRAMWATKQTVEASPECADDWAEYDEATDTYYCPEGWYEWNQNEETHWAVNETPRAWMPLPASEAKEL